ncbi:MAG: ATP-binding protein [Pseudomonadales bacterium]|nr:ATP-binding protein [Pseudomonadales bacterium]
MIARIYIGIGLSVLLAAILSFTLYSVSRDSRLEEYQANALSGAMQLIADSALRQPPTSRMQYYDLVAQLIGAELSTTPLGEAIADPLLLSVVRDGLPRQSVSQRDSIFWVLPFDETQTVGLEVFSLGEQQFRGQVLLVVAELNRQNDPRGLGDLQQFSSYQLSLNNLGNTPLDSQQQSRLARNSVVVDYDSDNQNAFSVYAPLSEDQVVVLGPVPQFQELPLQTVLGMIAVSLFVVVLVSSWLVFRLDRRLHRISSTLETFGHGDLSARVEMSGRDELTRLGDKIDTMAQQIESLLQSQREIMQAVSHELRTPLARIRFRLETIKQVSAPDLLRKSEDIGSDISELEDLIDEVIEHQKLVRAPELEKRAVNLGDLAANVVDKLAELYPTITVSMTTDHQTDFIANESAIVRLLQNLISNACKHASSKVHISLQQDEQTSLIRVEDDGPGVPEKEKEKVFTAFYRIDDSRNRETGGYGLGLAICRRILELHGATARVIDSAYGGACFECEFPKNRQEGAA